MKPEQLNQEAQEIFASPKVYRSTKIFDGFSTCFRQWRADGTHCRFLHGYGVSFRVTFVGQLDDRNWCFDFGGMKRSLTTIEGMPPAKWLDYLLDHTVIVAKDDPFLDRFKELDRAGVIQLRILPAVGAEKFAEYLLEKLNEWVREDSGGRVEIEQLEFFENQKNSAIITRNE